MSKLEYSRPASRFTMTRAVNILKSIFTNPLHLISIFAILFLGYTIVIPMWEIVSHTMTWHPEDIRANPQAVPGNLTLNHWLHVLYSDISQSIFYKPLLNSFNIAVFVSFFSMVIGGGLAWLVTRTDLPFKKTFAFLAIIPYMLPSWIKSFAWLIVFKNDRVGGTQGMLQYVFGINPPDWISYGFLPISIVLVGHYYTFFYLLIAVSLSSINSSLEETADILGASRFTILRKITFPLVLPAILSALILTFSKSMGTFGAAAFLGLPVKYYTIATMLYGSMKNRMISDAYVLSLILIIISALTIYFNQRAIGKRKSYATISGKDSRKNLNPLGIWKIPSVMLVFLFMFLAGIFPLLLLFWQTFMLQDGNYSLSNLTTHYWFGDSDFSIASGEVGILKSDSILLGLKNSLLIALAAASVASVMGLIFGYVISKGRKALSSRLVEQLSFMPYLIPGISFAAIYLSMFAQPHFLLPALYGTLSIVILITIVKELPFATRSGTSTMLQISGELEEAAKLHGASFMLRFFRIMLPLSRKGLISAFLLLFISAMKELDLIILLVTPKTSTLTTLTFRYAEKGYQQYADAIVIIIIALIMITHFVATKWGKADLSKGIGG
ncbi:MULTISPECIES: iron ABC transporter permease [Paenibacillus]|uniref:Iron ABC transporter permease n=1 Tax=Paenibacillus baimaensis TaxID=2982185 RepID=A0ABT2UIY0_9BACL|nr:MULTISPECIES: iron ABC transporter permease [unclassified Paenibacillus]MCU6794588.1 iron ABC transporter permease [Paenibacillus sp. WQ 127069]